ncbi:capsular polysaccharide transport system permease protein [Xanthobacter sp. SG618]|uniref:hypothetical protein n=1 Tax=Xanthobacter sp. SG618 TaxID=2587121 RepID=UPI00145D5CFC|nr:hypothetical protein [Xanthobacter sp. SG618]NMN56717.1 capsular polysaccharide transport system permease protein [Xanthobacter sp. SG618]
MAQEPAVAASPAVARIQRFLPLPLLRGVGAAISRRRAASRNEAQATLAEGRRAHLTRTELALGSFGLLVLLPAVATLLYLTFVAAPQYRSEARLVVRGNLETVSNASASPAANGIPQVANTQEARVVVDYLRSRAMVDALQEQLDLKRIFGISDRDPVFALSPEASTEDLVTYWNRQVSVSLEQMSGVIKVQVYAFSPQSAALLAAAVVRQAEQVTNDLTARNRSDRVVEAEAEERAAFTELAVVRTALETFRNSQGTLDPTKSASDAFAVISKLRDQRSALNTDLNAARARLDEDSPVVRALKERLRSLDEKIAALDGSLLGDAASTGSSGNLVAGAELEASRRLAEQRLKQAEAELIEARTDRGRQQVYILAFMAPTLPHEKAFPTPPLQAGAVFAILFAAWAVVALYVASVYARTR